MKQLVLVACCVVLALCAVAETYTWTGGSGNWTDGANWTFGGSTGTVPGSGDVAYLPGAASGYTVTVNEPLSVGGIELGSNDGSGGTVTLNFKHRAENLVAGDIQVNAGATITHTALGKSSALPESYRVALVCGGAFTLDAGAEVNASVKGFPAGYGPGYISGGGDSARTAHAATPDAGHCYGSVACPTNCGSGAARAGGGAVLIRATGLLTVNGTISCDGEYGTSSPGAGGSVWLTGSDLTGTGTVQARGGGSNSAYPGSGSGGRVAVHLTTAATFDSWSGTLKACAQGSNGGAGTIYLQAAGETRESATVIVDGNNVTANGRIVELGARTDSSVIGNLTVRNKGHVQVIPGEMVTIHGNLSTQSDSYYGDMSGTFAFAGTGVSTVTGNATLPNVSCVTPGKRIEFGTGEKDLFRVLNAATVTWRGAAGNPVTLSGVEGGTWKMALPGNAVQDIRYVTSSGSDASGGATVLAYDSAAGSVANVNWVMTETPAAGETVTWNGSAGTEWRMAGNWTPTRVPLPTDIAKIPSSAPAFPVLSVNGARIGGLTVESGTTVILSNANLTVAGDVTNAGRIVFCGAERLTLMGNADFTGGAVTPARSEFYLDGVAAQTVNLGGATFNDVLVRKTGGAVAFTDGFSADLLDVSQSAGLSLTFAAGKTVTCAELVLDGVTAVSSSPGTKWNVAVSAGADVRSTTVSDSRATAMTVFADMTSRDGGTDSCENWRFGSLAQTWTGAAGDKKWETAENWDPGVVPGPTSRVAIARSADVTAANDVEVQNLVVGGPSVTVTALFKGRLACEDGLDVRNGATLTFEKSVAVTNSVFVRSGGKLTHPGQPKNVQVYMLDLVCGSAFTLEAGAEINLDGKGFAAGYGPGYIGGSGDYARTAYASTPDPGYCYGSVVCPTNCGSGASRAGGGAVRVRAGGVVTVNGTITCNNSYGSTSVGTGGSIWLTGRDLKGSGTLQAVGGYSNWNYAGTGGGGRIALYLTEATTFDNWRGTTKACANQYPGGAGTIYLQAAGETRETATVIVDGNNVVTDTGTVELGARTDSSTIGNLIVRNKGRVRVIPGETVTIHGDLTMQSDSYYDAATVPGGTFAFAGTGVSTITGNAALPNVTCTTPGKVLKFGTGSTDNFTFHVGAKLTLAGTAQDPVVLLPSGSGAETWKIELTTDCSTDISHVSVSNSVATSSVLAIDSNDLGGNVNWGFSAAILPGDPIRWTGAGGNTLWTDAANWEDKDGGHRTPVETDCVIIPKADLSPSVWPVMEDGTKVQNSIRVGAGGELTLKNCTLYATNELTVAGCLAAQGTVTVISSNAVNLAGGTFAAGSSRFRLEGPAVQTVDPGNCTFNRFEIEKDGGSVTFADGFTAAALDVQARGEVTLAFKPGATVTAADIVCRGITNGTEVSSASLALSSATPGQRWRIAPTGAQYFSGVKVSDSQAVGEAVADALSVNGGNNVNWTFGRACSAWTGAVSTDFYNPANWYPVGVPGDSSFVVVSPRQGESATVDLGSGAAFACADLRVGTGLGKVTFTSDRPIAVAGDFEIGTNVTVTLSSKQVANTAGGDFIMRSGAKLTHKALSGTTLADDVYGVNVEVAGDVLVEAGAKIDVDQKGYAAGKGPGYISSSGGGDYARSAYASTSSDGYCYGSVFYPANAGSGANRTAGGTVRLVAGGTLRLDGAITSTLVGKEGGEASSCGTGGSVWLTAGVLEGSGSVNTRGGNGNSSYGGNGGRIAVHQTAARDFSAWTGTLQTGGGNNNGGPGTIYMRSAQEGPDGGTVKVVNVKYRDDSSYYWGRWCEFPVTGDSPRRTYRHAAVDVSSYSRVKLTTSVTVKDLVLSAGTSKLELGTNTLTVLSTTHKDRLGWAAKAQVTSVTNTETGVYGKIVWRLPGTVVIVR